jgi:hypothetical protein
MSTLSDPIGLGNVEAPNRTMIALMTRARCTRDHVPTTIMVEYYAQRASAGFILSEAPGISPQGLGWPLAPGIWNDVRRPILFGLLPKLRVKQDGSHLDDCFAHYRGAREGLDDLATGKPGRKLIHPQYLARLISERATEDAAFTFDVGTPSIGAARYLKIGRGRSYSRPSC